MRRTASLVVVCAWLAVLVGAAVTAAGMGPAGTAVRSVPPSTAAVAAVLRGLLGATAVWLLGASAAEAGRAACGLPSAIVGRSPLPHVVRRAVAGLMAGGLAVPAAAAVPAPAVHRLAVEAPARADTTPPAAAGETATLIGLAPTGPAPNQAAADSHGVEEEPHDAGADLPEWVVQPGEHVWGIAVNHLLDLWGRPPTDGEAVAHMHALIHANADRFVVPGNPDLIRPGQRLLLVPPSEAPSHEVQ